MKGAMDTAVSRSSLHREKSRSLEEFITKGISKCASCGKGRALFRPTSTCRCCRKRFCKDCLRNSMILPRRFSLMFFKLPSSIEACKDCSTGFSEYGIIPRTNSSSKSSLS
eukprot:m.52256 g.52256  ORF g.52256 m.52256 type:complete len:111 (+) comp6364_c0_seq2:1614-1946(+)